MAAAWVRIGGHPHRRATTALQLAEQVPEEWLDLARVPLLVARSGDAGILTVATRELLENADSAVGVAPAAADMVQLRRWSAS
ncbi:MAG TPA: hypothetical protein VMW80_03435 [Candidatus Dormibacteraeota bacterium]|nr:hypothetical protein [Candidatus Dormibacteraeota bacterium]